MADILIYANGECTKCKGTLELLQEMNVPHDVRFYLAEPLSEEELMALLVKLNIPASELIRRIEPEFTDYEGKELSEEEWIQAMLKHPVLMQRPVVQKGNKAIIARPPEKVLDFIK
jgi:arsenate reductase